MSSAAVLFEQIYLAGRKTMPVEEMPKFLQPRIGEQVATVEELDRKARRADEDL